jgi:VCBS repeat-containing protein
MDAFDNPARGGVTGSQRDGAPTDQANEAVGGSEFLAMAAKATAAASAIPIMIQAILVPDASGRIVLPAGASIDDITVSGNDLIVTLPNGQLFIIPGGAVDVLAIVIDGDTIPASTVAQLLENLDDLNPEARILSSGGNFADPEGAIQDPYALGDLLPYTELAFPQPEDRELLPDVPDEEPTISIVTPDQPAGALDATSSVNEAGLPARGSEPAGSNSAATSETVAGSIVYDAPDGLTSITINGTVITTVGQVVTTPLGQLTITSLTPGNVGYSYTLTDNTNANNNPTDIFNVVVTDSDSDTAPARLTISVVDDVPTARNDTDQLAGGTRGPETGNVLTGAGTTSGAAGADTQGADGATLTGIRGAGSESFSAPGTVQGQYGTLTIGASGSYSYVRNPGTPGGVNDVFTYRIADGDGDMSTATLTIAIGDAPTTITFVPGDGEGDAGTIVREADLPARAGEAPGSQFDGDAASTSGTITFTATDGVGSVTIADVTVTPGSLPQQIVSDATGTLVIAGYAYNAQTGQGSITYVYTLKDNVLDGDGSTVSFDFTITDLDGDAASDTLDIDIIDDAPTARPDVDSVTEDGPTVANGNVLTGTGGNDTNATDGVADVQGADGATVTAVAGGTVGAALAGAYGTLTLNADGSYSYVLDNAAQPVQGLAAGQTLTETFTYTITDGDGDTSTTTLTITINGADDGITINGINTEGGDLTVDEDDLADGSSPDAAALTQAGSLSISTPERLGNVTIGGTQVVTNGVFTPGTATSPLGLVNITGFTPVTGADGSVIGGTFTYNYVLGDNTLTHGTPGEDNVTDSFAVIVTDSDGSTGTDSIDVRIIDDVPTARADADSVSEDGGTGESPPTADGNVLTGLGGGDANATDGVADTQGADGAAVTAVTGGTPGQAFATAYGALTLNADGSYIYLLNNAAQPVQGLAAGETLTETFTYTITDGDGDTATATLTITINGADDGVTINGLNAEGAEVVVNEDDLADGSSPDAAALTQPGSFSISTPDGLGNVTIGGTQVVTNGVFAAGTATSPLGLINIAGFTPVLGADGSVIGGTFAYEYVLADNTLTHTSPGEDFVGDSFAVVVTDSDGSSANASLDVRIIDDVPTANPDVDSVSEDGGTGESPPTADGNVLSGSGGNDANATDGAGDVRGADGASVTGVTFGQTAGTVGTPLAGAYGTLTLGVDGSYSYALNNGAQPVQGLSAGQTLTEIFTYTITDGDGDPATTTLTITINGADDGVTINGLNAEGAELFVDEDDLPVRAGEAPGSDTTPDGVTDSDSFAVSTPDGMGTVVLTSFNGVPLGAPLTLVVANGAFTPQSVATAYGTLNVTGFTAVTGADGSVIGGTFTYSYTLTDNRADHPAAGQDNRTDSVGVTVTDTDGSSASATIDIRITDDVPDAIDDGTTQTIENGPVTINVLANDVQGADSVQPSAVQLVAGSLTGTGTLVNNGDGSFTYTPGAQETGSISFQYRITDGDGDTDVATATITLVADSAPQIGKPADVTVDEDGLAGANADNGLPGEVTSTGSASANGTITVDFGSDVPATLAGSLVLGDSAALDTQLTVNNVPVIFDKVGNDLVGSVGGNEVIRISLTTATTGPGATQVTYGYTVTLSQAIDQAVPGSEDSDFLAGIGFTVTDNDGTTASGAFGVTIVDDLPTLNLSDTPTTVVEGATATGTWTLDRGADGVASVNVSFGSGSATLSLAPGSSVSITQPTGVLTVNANGTFSFAAAGNQNNTTNPSASFTLSAVDRDGDPTSDSLTIAITDGANPRNVSPITLTVNEAALADGSNPASPAEVSSGDLFLTAGSDALSGFAFTGVGGLVANLDGAGTDLFWSMAPGGQTIIGSLTSGGPAAITISLTAPVSVSPGTSGLATVTVTLADNLPHALAMAAQTQALGTVTVQATDTDGDLATGVVTVQVTDDVPAVTAVAASANALVVDDSDLATNATANFGFGQPGSLFNVAFNADGPAAVNSIVYALDVKSVGVASGLVDTITGQSVVLTNEAGVVVGRTSGSGAVVFTLSVDANGTVTLDQQRPVFHSPDTGPDQATGLGAADLITLTATVTDSDGDPASATANIGGALTFKDDGVDIDITVVGEATILLTTQDGETIGAASDLAVSTANFSGAFAFANADFGEDGAGSITWNYALSLFGIDGADSGLDSNGASIFLYNVGGVITGSTAANAGAVNAGNTIFTLGANAANGTVTLTQFAQIDHAGPGVDSDFESQLAVLADNLVRLTGTVTITDRDGDTDSATQSIDLGGNVRFADDGPVLDITLKAGAELRIDETNGVTAAGTEVDPDATGSLGSATIAIADLYTVSLDAGADTPAAYSYAFVLGGANPASGYLISATNEVIRLYQTGPGTVEGRGETSGNVAFTFTVAANGTVTMTQLIAIEHGNTASNDETSPGMSAGALLLQVTATDFDGDFSRDTVDLGSIVRIEDDGPSITNVAGSGSVTLDETGGLDTNVTSAAAVITANLNFGADGAATTNSVVYGLSLAGNGTTPLTTALGDFAISLVATSATTITGRYTDGGGVERDAFTVTINADGTLTVSQFVALEHLQDGNTPLHNDALTLNGLVTASVTITDSDGDSVSATRQVGGQVTFLDDGPSVTATATGTIVLNDESATSSLVSTLDTGMIVKGDDPNVGGTGAISIATSGTAIITATPVYGADGAAVTGSLTYNMLLSASTSGLTITDGSPISLVYSGNSIVGRVGGSGAFAGQAAFAIAIDPDTGVVTVEQYLSLDHPVGTDPDDTLQLMANTVTVGVTVRDSDGDVAFSNVIDISGQIRFDDDGPTVSAVAGGASVTLDETGGFDTVTSATPVITAAFAYGADGPAATGATTYGIELTGGGTSAASGLATAVGDFAITLFETSATTIVGRYTDGGGVVRDAFTVTINADGTLTVTQLVALEHLQDGGIALHNDALTLTGLISATVTIKDGDDDTATGKTEIGDQITFLDDGPTANADTKSVAEGATATGNVLTDNADSFGADGPDATTPAGGVVGVRVAGGDTTTPVTTGTGTAITTALGTLTLGANGSYTYVAKPNVVTGTATDSFVYTIRDADGDTSMTTLTITINDSGLAASSDNVIVDEAALATGSNPSATTEVATGTIADNVSGGTGPFTYMLVGSGTGAHGTFVLNPNGGYTYTLTSRIDGVTADNGTNTVDNAETFTVQVTDTNGNSVTTTVTVDVIDDVPTARADPAIVVAEDIAGTVSGNLLDDDTQGADGATVTSVTIGATTTAIAATGNTVITTANGVYTFNAAGVWTFDPNPVSNAAAVNAGFSYTITDGDGDTATSTQAISLTDGANPIGGGSITLALDDQNLADGSTPAGPDSASGSLAFTPGSDAIASIVFASSLAGLGGGLTWVRVSDTQITGSDGARLVVTLDLVRSGNSANVTATLNDNYDSHPTVNVDDLVNLGSVGVVATDADGDQATGTVNVTVSDDLPTATLTATNESSVLLTTQDAQTIGAAVSDTATSTANFGGVFSLASAYGADGPGTTTLSYALGLVIANGSLAGLASNGVAIRLYTQPDGSIVGSTATTPAGVNTANTIFSLAANATTGAVTLTQFAEIDHVANGDTSAPYDDQFALLADGLVRLNGTATITDADNDTRTSTAFVDLGGNIRFADDGPSIAIGAPLPTLTVDETNFAANAVSAAVFTTNFGADGPGTVTYALGINAGSTGLVDTATGLNVVLTLVGNQVVATAGPGGATVFTVAVDASGNITLDQLRAIAHDTDGGPGAAHDDAKSLAAANLITLTGTITDGDGDSAQATINLGDRLTFKDDGPTVTADSGTTTEATLDFNAAFVLDFSGSIDTAELNLMLNAVRDAGLALFGSSSGDVSIRLVGFASTATSWGPFTDPVSFVQQIDALNPSQGGTRPLNSNTNFSAGINELLNVYAADPTASNQVFFLSDGNPNEGTGSGNALNATTAAAWNSFVNNNDVNVTAIGVGNGINDGPLQDIDVDGEGEILRADDFDDLVQTLLDAVVALPVSGDLDANDNFGGDGGRIQSITVGTTTYTWDGNNTITRTGTGPGTQAGNSISVLTPQGATLTLNFATGIWTYAPDDTPTPGSELFNYTVIDRDGDTAGSTLTVTVVDGGGPGGGTIANPDIVITNASGSGAAIQIAEAALLANDQAGAAITGAASNVTDATSVTRGGGNFTFTDNDADGGSFFYDTTPTDTARVTVNRAQAGEAQLDGTSANDILIGRDGADDTLVGKNGSDYMYGLGGNDIFNLANGNFGAGEYIDGGAGNDAIVLTNQTTINFTTGTIVGVETLTGSGSSDTVTMSAQQWAALSTINLAGGGSDALTVNVSGSVNISAASATTVSNTETGSLTGSGGADTITLTGAQLDAILIGSGTINLGGGTDTIVLTSTSNDLNGLNDAGLSSVEAISAAGATAGVKVNLANQSEAFAVTGSGFADTLVGGTTNDTLTGGAGADQFRFRSTTNGTDIVNDFTDGTDKIGFLDTGSTGSGSVNFGSTAGSTAGTQLNAADFVTRIGITNIASADDAKVIRISAAQTNAQITGDVSASSNPLDSYVLVFNSTTGRGEIWYDTDWDNTGNRVKVATLDNVTTLAQLNQIGADDIVAYSSATDPVILDLAGDGYAFGASALFDMNADGIVDRVTWNSSNDGILAVDFDGNGTIDSGSEIFTPGFGGGKFANGTEALASLDDNGDGFIDANDAAFAKLLVWQDANADGVSDAGELSGLADHGIASIATGAAHADETIDGQAVTARGNFTRTDGSTGEYIEAQLDTQLGTRGAARDAADIQRSQGNQALTSSLVAASLVAMVHDVRQDGGTSAEFAAEKLSVVAQDAIGATSATGDARAEAQSGPAGATAMESREAATAIHSPTPHADDASPAAIDDADDRGTAEPADRSGTGAPDSLFDMIADRAPSHAGTMDGLLSLGAAPAAAGGDAAAHDPAAQAVLAEVLEDGNAIDDIIDAVTGRAPMQVAASEAPAFDLAQFLDQKVAPAAAYAPIQPLEQYLHSMAAA